MVRGASVEDKNTPPLHYSNEQLPEDIATCGNGHLAPRGSFQAVFVSKL